MDPGRPLGIMHRPKGPFMGQAPPMGPLSIIVTDARGKPFVDVPVTLTGADARYSETARTDRHGMALFAPPAGHGNLAAHVEAGVYAVTRPIPPNEISFFIQVPVEAPEPFLKPVEIGIGLAGAAIAGVGFATEFVPLQVLGEVLFGAAAFTAIYRHAY